MGWDRRLIYMSLIESSEEDEDEYVLKWSHILRVLVITLISYHQGVQQYIFWDGNCILQQGNNT